MKKRDNSGQLSLQMDEEVLNIVAVQADTDIPLDIKEVIDHMGCNEQQDSAVNPEAQECGKDKNMFESNLLKEIHRYFDNLFLYRRNISENRDDTSFDLKSIPAMSLNQRLIHAGFQVKEYNNFNQAFRHLFYLIDNQLLIIDPFNYCCELIPQGTGLDQASFYILLADREDIPNSQEEEIPIQQQVEEGAEPVEEYEHEFGKLLEEGQKKKLIKEYQKYNPKGAVLFGNQKCEIECETHSLHKRRWKINHGGLVRCPYCGKKTKIIYYVNPKEKNKGNFKAISITPCTCDKLPAGNTKFLTNDELKEAASREPKKTGSEFLDKLTGGYLNENLGIIVGRNNCGKTRASIHFTFQILEGNPNSSVLYSSIEMGRTIAKIFNEVYESGEWIDKYYGQRLFIPDLNKVILDNIESSIIDFAWKNSGRDRTVVIDNLGVIVGDANDSKKCTDLMLLLKGLALEHHCRILVIHHINKSPNRHMSNKDLFESMTEQGVKGASAIVEYSDFVITVYGDKKEQKIYCRPLKNRWTHDHDTETIVFDSHPIHTSGTLG